MAGVSTEDASSVPSASNREPTFAEYAGAPRVTIWSVGAVVLRSADKQQRIPKPHAHFAIQVSLGTNAAVTLRVNTSGSGQAACGWIIGHDRTHSVSARGPTVSLLVDPISTLGRRLTSRLGTAPVSLLSEDECARIRSVLEACWKRGWESDAVRDLAQASVGSLDLPEDDLTEPMDPRIRSVLASLASHSTENVRVEDLAMSVGLSESRLCHLFRDCVGIPIRQYRLALRAQHALAQVSEGHSLTRAAHEAGFSDSAHFSRICRRMFGNAPSNLPARRRGD